MEIKLNDYHKQVNAEMRQSVVAAKPTTASPPAPAKFKELDFVEKKKWKRLCS